MIIGLLLAVLLHAMVLAPRRGESCRGDAGPATGVGAVGGDGRA
ncbi:MAG: hypothetical protein SWK76_12445 [Actinomycetota bacterium]|nr:hypothetical protein [Actinomycetota bacterium]